MTPSLDELEALAKRYASALRLDANARKTGGGGGLAISAGGSSGVATGADTRVSAVVSASMSQADLMTAYLATIAIRVGEIALTNQLLRALNNGGVVLNSHIENATAREAFRQGNGVVS